MAPTPHVEVDGVGYAKILQILCESSVWNFIFTFYDTELSIFFAQCAKHIILVYPKVLVERVGIGDFTLKDGEHLTKPHPFVVGRRVQHRVADAVEVPLPVVEGEGAVANRLVGTVVEVPVVDVVAAYIRVGEVFEAFCREGRAAAEEDVVAGGHGAPVGHFNSAEVGVIDREEGVIVLNGHVVVMRTRFVRRCGVARRHQQEQGAEIQQFHDSGFGMKTKNRGNSPRFIKRMMKKNIMLLQPQPQC